jgi:hypothetical protein
MRAPLSLLCALLPAAVRGYSDDYYYEEYENIVIKDAPESFEYVYERKLAYDGGVEEVYLHLC